MKSALDEEYGVRSVSFEPFAADNAGDAERLFHETAHAVNARDYSLPQLDARAPCEETRRRKIVGRLRRQEGVAARERGILVGFGTLSEDGVDMRTSTKTDRAGASRDASFWSWSAWRSNGAGPTLPCSPRLRPAHSSGRWDMASTARMRRSGMGLPWRTAACRNRLHLVPPKGRLTEMAARKATESGHGCSLRERSAPTRKVARHGDSTVAPSFDRRARIASTSRLAIEARSNGNMRSLRNLPSIMKARRGRNAAPNAKKQIRREPFGPECNRSIVLLKQWLDKPIRSRWISVWKPLESKRFFRPVVQQLPTACLSCPKLLRSVW